MIFTESAKTRGWKKSILREQVEKKLFTGGVEAENKAAVGDRKVLPLGTAPFYFLLIHCPPNPAAPLTSS